MVKKQSVNIISLGCPRNLVDSEVMLGLLKDAGFRVSGQIEGTDIVIINTCAFIEDAKKESVDIVLQLIDLKKRGKVQHLVISGCLVQRYRFKLKDELGEIDGFVGVGDIQNIVNVIKTISDSKKVVKVRKRPRFLYNHTSPRLFITPSHYAYIKIQEGCINRCSYCVIPDLRGDYRSRPIESIVKEADTLLEKMSEINLIGQDTTLYGIDRYERVVLPELLKKVSKLLKREAWIRLLYTHPAHFTDELIEVIRDYPICKYVDLPIQHINDKILEMMNRPVKSKEIFTLIQKLRDRIPDAVLRTSVILGFPGESATHFKELLNFIKDTKFERLGAFIYSREEGPPAYSFKGQVPEKLKEERFAQVMKLQQSISAENNKKFLNKVVRVLIDKRLNKEDNQFLARTQGDAPEVDGGVYLKADRAKVGSFVDAKITGTLEYDLVGEQIP